MTVLKNIRKNRESRNFSQEYMAFELGISQPAYAMVENGKTALTVGRLLRILQILDIKMEDLQQTKMDRDFNYNSTINENILYQKIYEENKEIYLKLIRNLEFENEALKDENRWLRDIVNKKKMK